MLETRRCLPATLAGFSILFTGLSALAQAPATPTSTSLDKPGAYQKLQVSAPPIEAKLVGQHPQNQMLFATSPEGVLLSYGGARWQIVGYPGALDRLQFGPDGSWYGTSPGGAIRKSVDQGASWQTLDVTINPTIPLGLPGDGQIYAAGSKALAVDTNGLGSLVWEKLPGGLHPSALLVTETNDVLIGTTTGEVVSFYGGSWAAPIPVLSSAVTHLAFNGGSILAASIGETNTAISTDGGRSWSPLPEVPEAVVSIAPSNPPTMERFYALTLDGVYSTSGNEWKSEVLDGHFSLTSMVEFVSDEKLHPESGEAAGPIDSSANQESMKSQKAATASSRVATAIGLRIVPRSYWGVRPDLVARLTKQQNPRPGIAGKVVLFYRDGIYIGRSTTDSGGTAKVQEPPITACGQGRRYTAVFAGDSSFLPSQVTIDSGLWFSCSY